MPSIPRHLAAAAVTVVALGAGAAPTFAKAKASLVAPIRNRALSVQLNSRFLMRTQGLQLAMAGLAAVVVCAASLIGAGAAVAIPVVSVVAKGLNAPRYLTFGPGGNLYLAVAGDGSNTRLQCQPGLGTRDVATQFCVGSSSAVDEITLTGHNTPLLKLLGSVRETDTGEVTGVNAVAFHGGHPVVLFGNLQSDALGQSPFGTGAFGYLERPGTSRDGTAQNSISAFAATHPQSPATLGGLPGETVYDSDPHDLVPYRGGYAVADAGANDVLLVSSKYRVSIAARLPTTNETAPAGALGPGSPAQTIAAQAVPSSVTVGPDGALYVGVLRGLPGLPGSAAVYRVVPGQAPVAVVTGLTRVSDLAFTPAGNLLILENNTGGALAPLSTPGALLTATLNGTTPVTATDLDVLGLVNPIGLAVNSSGDAYITNHASGTHQGAIIKVSGLG